MTKQFKVSYFRAVLGIAFKGPSQCSELAYAADHDVVVEKRDRHMMPLTAHESEGLASAQRA